MNGILQEIPEVILIKQWLAVGLYGWFMVFNATFISFNNISAISRQTVLLVEETGVPAENHRHWQTLWHNVVSWVIWKPYLKVYDKNNMS